MKSSTKRKRSDVAPSEQRVSLKTAGLRCIFLPRSSVPVFVNYIEGSDSELALLNLSGPLDSGVIRSALEACTASSLQVRQAGVLLDDAQVLPGLVVNAGSARSAAAIMSIVSAPPDVVDGRLVGLRGT
jgi:hypothetical protein